MSKIALRRTRLTASIAPGAALIPPCPFCSLTAERFVLQSELAVVIRDGFPVSPGHTLIIPKRHVGSFFEIKDAERAGLDGAPGPGS